MRLSVPAALAALVLGLPVLFVQSSAAQAATTIFVEVNPSTAPVGDEVAVRASCTDNLKSATVSSGLFGTLTVQPQFGFLTVTSTIPGGTKPGDYRLDLHCPDGKTASTTLHVVAKVEPSQGPATGGGGMAPGRNAPMLLGGGLIILLAAALLGGMSLRRRRLG
jgi:hypothetical protein